MTKQRDIFQSEPAEGAVVTDATGPDDKILVDIENGIGDKLHFEIVNKDQFFKPSTEIKPPSGAGKAQVSELRKHLVIFRMPA